VVRNTDLPALQLTNILRIILKCIVGKEGWRVWIWLNWLRIGINDELLWPRQ
jgi:hypothetical protein